MKIVCPRCGCRRSRLSHTRNLYERVRSIAGGAAVRCLDCKYRFFVNTWRAWELFFAHCPRCYNRVLTEWSEKYLMAPRFDRLLLFVGGHKHRCDSCRCNFVSLRPRMSARRVEVYERQVTEGIEA